MNDDHKKGTCHMCLQETMIRWKNIYHMGSEGLDICQPCENKIVKFVRDIRTKEIKNKLILIKKFKQEKKSKTSRRLI